VEKKVAVAAPFLMKSRREAASVSQVALSAAGVVVCALMSNSLLMKKTVTQTKRRPSPDPR
jgi:hypothetical protein